MAINFNKRKSQEDCERYICEAEQMSPNVKYEFTSLSLSQAQETELREHLQVDAKGFYYNALVSFLQGIVSLRNNSISWACVELYYSVYYSLRAQLAYHQYALIRKKGLYLLKVTQGQSPIKKSNKKYNNDHGGAINHFKDIFQDSDYLCSNNIDGKDFYDWLMDLRETTHYRNITFNEPGQFDILEKIILNVRKGKDAVKNLLAEFEGDWGSFCFAEEYAWLAGPYKKIQEVNLLYQSSNEHLDDEQIKYIGDLLSSLGLEDYKSTFIV